MRHIVKRVSGAFMAAVIVLSTWLPLSTGHTVNAADHYIPVQLLGINDFHGAIDGAEFLAGTMDQARDAFLEDYAVPEDHSIRVQAGDMVGGSPALSARLRDEPTIKVLNLMGIQIGTIGNHEFDHPQLGLAEFDRLMRGEPDPDAEPAYPLVASDMNIVVANVLDKQTGEPPFGFRPYTIQEVDGVKIGFIGVMGEDAYNLVQARENAANLDFLPADETIAKYAEVLRNEEQVDAIVVLAHTASQSGIEMMRSVHTIDPEHSVDVFFSGHDHVEQNYYDAQTGVHFVQAETAGTRVSQVIGFLDPDTGDFAPGTLTSIVNRDGTVKPNQEIQEVVADARERLSDIFKRIGRSATEDITKEMNQHKESELGNLVAQIQLDTANSQGLNVDFAFTSNGSIRSDLFTTQENGENHIEWLHAHDVQPFRNTLDVVEIQGKYILEGLAQQRERVHHRGNYILNIAGMTRYTAGYQEFKDPETGEMVQDSDETNQLVLLPDGTPLNPEKTYRIVINNFLRGGGEDFSAFTNGTKVDELQGNDLDTLVHYIEALETKGEMVSAQIDGRKEIVSETELKELGEQADQAAANMVIEKIGKLPSMEDVDLTHAQAIRQAREAFEALTQEQQALVANLGVLEALEARLQELEDADTSVPSDPTESKPESSEPSGSASSSEAEPPPEGEISVTTADPSQTQNSPQTGDPHISFLYLLTASGMAAACLIGVRAWGSRNKDIE